MQLAYELATAEDPDTREILENTIILLIPSPNPDGIDIVANWYRKTSDAIRRKTARALPSRRSRRQSRLVHAQPQRDSARHPFAVA